MNQARYLYSELSLLVQARLNCYAAMQKLNPNAVTANTKMLDNEYHLREDWFHRHTARILELASNYLPHGSGFDSGTHVDLDASHAEKLVLATAFHHMNENGFYDGWTEHVITVTPSLAHDFHIRVSGRDRNDIKEYMSQEFRECLSHDVSVTPDPFSEIPDWDALLRLGLWRTRGRDRV